MESKQSCDTLNAVTVDESHELQPQVAIPEYGLCSFRRCFARGFSVVFLLWQLVGSVLYFIRAYSCCIEQREASFRCSHAAAFPHSQEYELAWLMSLNAYIILFTFILSKIPGFLGFAVIPRKAIRLPVFWALASLQITQMIAFGIIMHFNSLTSVQIFMVANFCLFGMGIICIICVLNFTAISSIKNSHGSLTYVFSKLALVLLFQQTFVIFIVGALQLAFKVTGLDDVGRSANFVIVFRKLREFPQVIFFYKTSTFLFRKIFMDYNNIMIHGQYLKLRENFDRDMA